MEDAYEELVRFLKHMFQFDQNDLDFGIYKIYNLKRREIERFLTGDGNNDLKPLVDKAIKQAKNQQQEARILTLKKYIEEKGGEDEKNYSKDLEKNKKKIKKFIKLKNPPEKQELLDTLKSATSKQTLSKEMQGKIYNYILDFFNLYYSDGDFGYNTRSISPYKVEYDEDYDGSDTLFFWKHKDQYYIKSAQGFNSITFDLHGKKVLRLETNEKSEGEGVSQNNNRDTSIKHYKFDRIEKENGLQKVIFNLSTSSTPKAEIIMAIMTQWK